MEIQVLCLRIFMIDEKQYHQIILVLWEIHSEWQNYFLTINDIFINSYYYKYYREVINSYPCFLFHLCLLRSINMQVMSSC